MQFSHFSEPTAHTNRFRLHAHKTMSRSRENARLERCQQCHHTGGSQHCCGGANHQLACATLRLGGALELLDRLRCSRLRLLNVDIDAIDQYRLLVYHERHVHEERVQSLHVLRHLLNRLVALLGRRRVQCVNALIH